MNVSRLLNFKLLPFINFRSAQVLNIRRAPRSSHQHQARSTHIHSLGSDKAAGVAPWVVQPRDSWTRGLLDLAAELSDAERCSSRAFRTRWHCRSAGLRTPNHRRIEPAGRRHRRTSGHQPVARRIRSRSIGRPPLRLLSVCRYRRRR